MATRAWEQPRDAAPTAPATDASAASAADNALNAAAAETTGGGDAGASEMTTDTPGKRKRRMLTESHLLSAEGLKKIHRTFPYQVSSDVSGQEAKALRSLINMYKQWAFDLYPGLNFEDFLERTEHLGRQHGVQGLMADLREKERKRAVRLEREAEDGEDNARDDSGEERRDAQGSSVIDQQDEGKSRESEGEGEGEEAML